MELRSLTRISLPKDEYVYLLGMAISVFISNNGFIIENIINTDKSYSWHDLIDVNVNIRMYNFDDVQCTVIPSVAYGFVTGMNLQLC